MGDGLQPWGPGGDVRPVKSVRAGGDGVAIKESWNNSGWKRPSKVIYSNSQGRERLEEGVNEAETFPERKHSPCVLGRAGRM